MQNKRQIIGKREVDLLQMGRGLRDGSRENEGK